MPSIDIVRGKVVRLTKGRLDEVKVYCDDPVKAARRWVDEGAEALHVVDIEAAMGVGDNLEAIKRVLTSVDVEVQVAGGIRCLERARDLVDSGASRVVVGTLLVEKPSLVAEMVKELGSQRVVAALDHRSGKVVAEGWLKETKLDVYRLAKEAERLGVGWILFSSVERDGTLSGVDVDAVEKMVRSVSLPVLVAGGVATLKDVEDVARAGAAGLVVGKALYEGVFTIDEAKRRATSR